MTYGELKVSQGTSDFLQGSNDFDKNIELLKDKIREFFNLKDVNFLFGFEQAVLQSLPCRSCMTIYSLMKERKSLNVVSDVFSKGRRKP